jgi:hypothetical protein
LAITPVTKSLSMSMTTSACISFLRVAKRRPGAHDQPWCSRQRGAAGGHGSIPRVPLREPEPIASITRWVIVSGHTG